MLKAIWDLRASAARHVEDIRLAPWDVRFSTPAPSLDRNDSVDLKVGRATCPFCRATSPTIARRKHGLNGERFRWPELGGKLPPRTARLAVYSSESFRLGKRREYHLAYWTIHGTVKLDESSAEPEASQGNKHQRISCRSFPTASRTSQSFTIPFQSPLASTLPSGLIANL